jgi:hypothetical protein
VTDEPKTTALPIRVPAVWSGFNLEPTPADHSIESLRSKVDITFALDLDDMELISKNMLICEEVTLAINVPPPGAYDVAQDERTGELTVKARK